MDISLLVSSNDLGISSDIIMELIENRLDQSWTCKKCNRVFKSRTGGRHKDPARVAFFKAINHKC